MDVTIEDISQDPDDLLPHDAEDRDDPDVDKPSHSSFQKAIMYFGD